MAKFNVPDIANRVIDALRISQEVRPSVNRRFDWLRSARKTDTFKDANKLDRTITRLTIDLMELHGATNIQIEEAGPIIKRLVYSQLLVQDN